jgi:hypothetical protein
MTDPTTRMSPDELSRTTDEKEGEAGTLGACAAAVGGAGAVALGMNPGSMAAIGIVAACGVVAAFMLGNQKEVEKNVEQLRASRASFLTALDENTTAAGRLIDAEGTGINRAPGRRG